MRTQINKLQFKLLLILTKNKSLPDYEMYYGNNITTWFDDGIPFSGLQTCTLIGESEFRPWDCLTTGAKSMISNIICP